MFLHGFKVELRRLLIIFVICVGYGVLFGLQWWLLFTGLCLYLAWLFYQMYRLNKWLIRGTDEPPESSGLWGEIFDNIYKLQCQQRAETENLQAVIKRIQEITSALKDGIIILDWRGHLDFWNPAAQRMIGFRTKDQGQSIINFIRDPKFVEYFEGDNYAEPLDLQSPRHSSKQLQIQITRFGQQERLIVIRDITQVHNLEQMRQDFVANVSHELRTPLTVINGYIETISDNNKTPTWEKPLQQILQQGKRMSLLINDLLVLSKLETTEAGHNQKELELEPLLISIKNEADALGNDKQQTIRLQCDEPIRILANEKEIHSAFSNLAINAVKYTPENGVIDLHLWKNENHVYFSVTDNGPGIDSKHLPRLTERFYRVDASRNSATGGTGLGLAIVKHVLLRHDGELKITSELGKG
ncbi:MAG TPA: phosphate regulon sensor histidine kinase PhoR, partial [Cellvibrio sp.]|nr:phosphate regulon sensor histidine kinase PhoR [Cellvibrio sp.]